MRYLCFVSYKGTAYQGWQKQLDTPTVQGTIEATLSQFFNQEILIQASGRTDAGVHALEQTFHFDIDKEIVDFDRFLYSINQMLPSDISILKIVRVSDDFHARFSAKGKKYLYQITYKEKNALNFDISYNCMLKFDEKKFHKALTYFNGEHDFRNFTSKEEDESNFIRQIYDIKLTLSKNRISIEFYGNGFMRYMIRFMIGTALACAQDKISFDEIVKLLNPTVDERNIVSYKAPPQGLYLEKVIY